MSEIRVNTIDTKDNTSLTIQQNNNTAITIDTSQNVGIGTSSPSSYNSLADNLVVGTTSGDNGITIATGTANGGRIIFSDNTASPFRGAFEYDHSTDGMITYTNGTEAMRINSSGVVNIGTTTPVAGATALSADGISGFQNQGNYAISINRQTNDGRLINLQRGGDNKGSIGIKDGYVFIGTGDTGFKFNDTGDDIIPFNLNTESDRDNVIDLGASGTRFKNLYLGGNIYLGGTGSANALDDYEEGTFTITLTPSTSGSLTLSSTSDSCYYTKVGRTVFVQGRIVVDASSSPTGSALDVGGLPFTIQSPTEGAGYFGGMCAISFNGSNTFDAFPITAYSASGTTKITCSSVSSMNSNTRIHFNFFYYTAS